MTPTDQVQRTPAVGEPCQVLTAVAVDPVTRQVLTEWRSSVLLRDYGPHSALCEVSWPDAFGKPFMLRVRKSDVRCA